MFLFFLILFLIPTAKAPPPKATPSVGIVEVTDPINLLESSTVTVWCNATISVSGNWKQNDVLSVNGTIWHSSSSEGAADDNNSHYTNSSCFSTDVETTEVQTNCSFSLQYYSNPNTWTCKLGAFMSKSDTSADNQTNTTVNTLLALSIPGTIDFGSMTVGQNSTDTTENVSAVENTGNVLMDIQLSGDAMSCTTGSIPVSNIKYSAVDNTPYASMTALSENATTLGLNVSQRTDGVSTKDVFWKISIPNTGIDGVCSNTMTFTAIAS